jgi:prolyl-tRNA synthetase
MEEAGEDEEVLTGSAKTLCIPFEQEPLQAGTKCFACGQDAQLRALWGRTY